MYNGLKFEEDDFNSYKIPVLEHKSKMVKLFEAIGVPVEYVNVVMVVVAVLFLVITIFLLFFSNTSGIKRPSPDEIIKIAGPYNQ